MRNSITYSDFFLRQLKTDRRPSAARSERINMQSPCHTVALSTGTNTFSGISFGTMSSAWRDRSITFGCAPSYAVSGSSKSHSYFWPIAGADLRLRIAEQSGDGFSVQRTICKHFLPPTRRRVKDSLRFPEAHARRGTDGLDGGHRVRALQAANLSKGIIKRVARRQAGGEIAAEVGHWQQPTRERSAPKDSSWPKAGIHRSLHSAA